MSRKYHSFREFYAFYLAEHSNKANRRVHFVGLTAALAMLITFAVTLNWWFLAAVPIVGYVPSWFGHLVFERNVPASFANPFYSLRGDLLMYREMLTGKIKF